MHHTTESEQDQHMNTTEQIDSELAESVRRRLVRILAHMPYGGLTMHMPDRTLDEALDHLEATVETQRVETMRQEQRGRELDELQRDVYAMRRLLGVES
jgi:sugar phosphate isomerase/epimerase